VRVLFFIFIFICWLPVQAQPTLNPINMSMGSGGAAYLTGPQANFYNPANLLLQQKPYNFSITLGTPAGYFEPVLRSNDVSEQYENFKDMFLPFSGFDQFTSSSERNEVIDRLFKESRNKSDHIARFELHWFGVSWKHQNRSFSLALRTRGANRFDVGRGWYDIGSNNEGNQQEVSRLIRQQTQVYHELSFGYAESFDFLSNLTPRLDRFSIGIAPKFVISGAHFDAVYDNKFDIDTENGAISSIRSFSQTSTGNYTDLTKDFLSIQNSELAISNNLDTRSLYQPTGFGAGLDFGITYLITFGDDLSTLRSSTVPTDKSLRFSFSITDVGLVLLNKDPLELTAALDTSRVSELPETTSDIFQGSQGGFLAFLDQNNAAQVFAESIESDDDLTSLLATALHTGVLFELKRIKFSGDLNLGLKRNAFHSTTLFAHFGMEILPFKFLPLRAGTRLGAKSPALFGLGTGIETKKVDLSLAIQFSSREFWQKTPLAGTAFTALQFYF